MRFLNRKWAEGGYDDFTMMMYWNVYMHHLNDIAADLPKMARTVGFLTKGKALMGTEVAATSLDADSNTFKLVLRLRTIEGDAYLELKYKGIDPDAVDEHLFDGIECVLTDELDLAPDECFEHRILLSPKGEFTIQFNDMELALSRPGEEE